MRTLARGLRQRAAMARHDERPVPRGSSHRWELILGEDERVGEAASRTALDVRADHRVLAGFADEDLAAIPLVPEGQPLARFGEYLDLHDPARANFLAEGTEVVRPGQRIVARKSVAKGLWDDLRAACAEVTSHPRRP